MSQQASFPEPQFCIDQSPISARRLSRLRQRNDRPDAATRRFKDSAVQLLLRKPSPHGYALLCSFARAALCPPEISFTLEDCGIRQLMHACEKLKQSPLCKDFLSFFSLSSFLYSLCLACCRPHQTLWRVATPLHAGANNSFDADNSPNIATC